jgi:hypothetical protein
MTFFDKKQDVLKIELTPYGRSLLSNGKLMPKYYAFFDDDIIYDAAALGATESQDEIKSRIVNETPRLRPQRDLQSVESIIYTNERNEEGSRPHQKLSLNYLSEPLGTSDGTEEKASSWNVTTILGEIDSVDQFLATSGSYLRQIPQLNMTIEYTMQVANDEENPPVRGQAIPLGIPASQIFEDGTYVEILEEQIILRMLEENGFKFKEGIEMEAYMFSDDEQELHKLKMTPRTKSIVDGFLVETEEEFIEIDETYLEHYIMLYFDEAIADADICRGVSKLKSEDILLDIDIECPDVQGVDFDIYRTRVTDVEKC